MATSQTSWLANATVVDVEEGRALVERSVEIVDGAIAAISATLPPGQSNVIDVGGRFVVPGLISCHTHLSIVFPMSATDPTENPAATVLRAAKRARDALGAGITTLRCVHEQHRADLWLRDAQRRGWADVPRIFGAGQAITTPKGHGAGAAWAEAEGEEDFYRAAIEELEAGADHVKVAINGGLAREGEEISRSEMTDEELDGTVRAAQEHGTYVVAHSGASRRHPPGPGPGRTLLRARLRARLGHGLPAGCPRRLCHADARGDEVRAMDAGQRLRRGQHRHRQTGRRRPPREHQARHRRRSAAAVRDGPAPGR